MIEEKNFLPLEECAKVETAVQRRVVLSIVRISILTGLWLIPFAVLGLFR